MNPLRLLLVEDDVDSAESLKLLLEYNGHQVQWARSGAEAIQTLQSLAGLNQPLPDVALLDLMLPDMSGARIATEIRALQPQLAVILLSAAPEYVLRHAAQESGAFGILRKPAEWSAITAALQSVADSIAVRRPG